MKLLVFLLLVYLLLVVAGCWDMRRATAAARGPGPPEGRAAAPPGPAPGEVPREG